MSGAASPRDLPNSAEALEARARAGVLSWRLVVVVCFARLGLSVAAQAVSAAVLHAQGVERPFEAAAAWFTVHGTLVDLGSLALLAWCLRREGLSVTDLFRAAPRPRWWAVLGQAVVALLLMGAAGAGMAALLGLVLLGTPFPPPPVSSLPTWAGLYSTLVWPLLWGFVEQATYDGYAAPRVAALSRSRWALAVVWLGFAAQHLALPLRFDATFLALRVVPSFAVGVVMVALYLRTRQLLPLALAHWAVDAATGALTLAPAATGAAA